MPTRPRPSLRDASDGSTGRTVSPTVARDPTTLEGLATTVKAWSSHPRREALGGHAPTEHAATYAQHREEERLLAPTDAYAMDDEGSSARDAYREADVAQRVGRIPRRAIDWAKWDTLTCRDGDIRVLIIAYRDGGIAVWNCADLDNFIELLSLDKVPSAEYEHPDPSLQPRRRACRTLVDAALLSRSTAIGVESVLVLLTRSSAPAHGSARSQLSMYSLLSHEIVQKLRVAGTAHRICTNSRLAVVSTTGPLALHLYQSTPLGELVALSPSSPILDLAPSSFDGAPVFALGAGGRFLAYATTNLPSTSRLDTRSGAPGTGILAISGSFDSTSPSLHALNRAGLNSFSLCDAPDVARRVSDGILGSMSAVKEAGWSYWQQSQSVQARPIAGTCDARRNAAHPTPHASEMADCSRPAASAVVVLDVASTRYVRSGEASPGNTAPSAAQDSKCRLVAHFSPAHAAISHLSFSPSSTALLVGTDGAHHFDVFELKPRVNVGRSAVLTGPAATNDGKVLHRYQLERGVTTAHIAGSSWAPDGRFVAVSTTKGTAHVYALRPAFGSPDLGRHFGPHASNAAELPPLSLPMKAVARLRTVPATTSGDNETTAEVPPISGKAFAPSVAFVSPSDSARSSFGHEPPSSDHEEYATQDILAFHASSGAASLYRLEPFETAAVSTIASATSGAVTAVSRGDVGKLASTAVSGLTQLMRSRGADLGFSRAPPPTPGGLAKSGSTVGAQDTTKWVVRSETVANWDLRRRPDWPECRRTIEPANVALRHPASTLSRFSSNVEVETYSRAPNVLPRSIYSTKQFEFYGLPSDYRHLEEMGSIAAPGRKIGVRAEVRVCQGAPASAAQVHSTSTGSVPPLEGAPGLDGTPYDQSIKSAMHTFLDPQTVLAPGSPQLRPPTFPNGTPGRQGSWRDAIQLPRGVAPAALDGFDRVRHGLGQLRMPRSLPKSLRRGGSDGMFSSSHPSAYSTSVSFEDEDAVFAESQDNPSFSLSTACTSDLDSDRSPAGFGGASKIDIGVQEGWEADMMTSVRVTSGPKVVQPYLAELEPFQDDSDHFELELPSVSPSQAPPIAANLAQPSPLALTPVADGQAEAVSGALVDAGSPTSSKSTCKISETSLSGQCGTTLAAIPFLAAKSTLALPTNSTDSGSLSSSSSLSSSPIGRNRKSKNKGKR